MKEAELYFNFLLQVAGADGDFDDLEIEYIEACAEAIDLSDEVLIRIKEQIDLLKSKKKLTPLDKILKEVRNMESPSLIMTMLRDGYAIANADGNACSDELNVLKELLFIDEEYCERLFERAIDWAKKSHELKVQGEIIFSEIGDRI